jgi:hypothetical protein
MCVCVCVCAVVAICFGNLMKLQLKICSDICIVLVM